jgi:hypothetical protein
MPDPLFDCPPSPCEVWEAEQELAEAAAGVPQNYSRCCNDTVQASDEAWTPQQLRRNEVLTAIDAVRVERITFLRTCNEVVTAVDRPRKLSLRVGEVKKGWSPEIVQKLVYWDLEPEMDISFIVEDQLDFRTLSAGRLRLHNTEAHKVWAKVEEHVLVSGVWQAHVILDEMIIGHGVIDVEIPNTSTIPQKPVTSPMRLVYREVTLTNQETDRNSLVIALVSGWSARSTTLPVAFPGV